MLRRLAGFRLWLLISPCVVSAQGNPVEPATDSLLALVQQAPDDTLKARRYMELAVRVMYHNAAEAEEYCNQALSIFRKQRHFEGESHALNLRGLLISRKAQDDRALADFIESYTIAKEHNLPRRMAKALNNMGIIYLRIKDYERALSTWQEAIAINESLHDVEELGSNLANCGVVLVNQNKLDSALVVYHNALSKFLDVGMIRGIATMYNNIGNIQMRKNRYDEALFYYQKSLEQYQSENNVLYLANVLNNIGRVYLFQGLVDSASAYLQEGLRLAENQKAVEEISDSHEYLSLLYEKTGDPTKSLFHLREHYKWRDSLFNQDKTNELNRISQEYAIKKQLDLQENENELKSARSLAWIILLAALIIIITLTGIIYNISLARGMVRRSLYDEEKARNQAEKEARQLREEHFNHEIDLKNRELASTTINIIQKNDLLQLVTDNLEQLKKVTAEEAVRKELSRLTRLIENGLNQEKEWESFRLHFDGVHPGFFDRLMDANARLTPKDLRICAYLRMNLSTKEIASLLNFSVRGVETIRYRLRKKLDLPPEADLNQWMMRI